MADFVISQALGLALAACKRQGWKVPAAFFRCTPFFEQGAALEIHEFSSDASEGLSCLQIVRSLEGAVGVYVAPRSHVTSTTPSNSWIKKPVSNQGGISLDIDTPPAADVRLQGSGDVESLDFWITDIQNGSKFHPQAALAIRVFKEFLTAGFPAAKFLSENSMPISLETSAPANACDQIEEITHRSHKLFLCWNAIQKSPKQQGGRGNRQP